VDAIELLEFSRLYRKPLSLFVSGSYILSCNKCVQPVIGCDNNSSVDGNRRLKTSYETHLLILSATRPNKDVQLTELSGGGFARACGAAYRDGTPFFAGGVVLPVSSSARASAP
jgi:hypothetical protein